MSHADELSDILLIDDDVSFCTLMRDYFANHAIKLSQTHDGKSGLEAVRRDTFELILLDMLLPDMHGVEVLRQIRQTTDTPVIILSAYNEETDRIVTLEMGADDYVPKTFSSRELLAHIRAVLRRHGKPPGEGDPEEHEILQLRSLRLNNKTKEARLNDTPLDLTAMEFRMLWLMASQAGRVFTRENLMDILAEREFNKYDRSVDVHISSLRRKLGDDSKTPQYIKTMRGLGYCIIK